MIKKEDSKSPQAGNEKPKKRMTAQQREEILVENFVGLQRAMTNLSIKFSALSENINKLLQIFEEAAKNYSFKDSSEDESTKEVMKKLDSLMYHKSTEKNLNEGTKDELIRKLDSLIDQNKIIAQGLVVMEEKLRPRAESVRPVNETFHPRPRPLPSR